MPMLAILLTGLGLIPFIVCGLGALALDPGTAARMLSALIGYAALTLAFAAGVHWGFELQAPQEDRFIHRARLGVPAIALLAGWIALLLPLVVAAWVALVLLIAAYVGAIFIEQQAARRGLLPGRYLWLRWGFIVVALAMLVSVLTLRLLGLSVTI
jgi:hypothetical protein